MNDGERKEDSNFGSNSYQPTSHMVQDTPV